MSTKETTKRVPGLSGGCLDVSTFQPRFQPDCRSREQSVERGIQEPFPVPVTGLIVLVLSPDFFVLYFSCHFSRPFLFTIFFTSPSIWSSSRTVPATVSRILISNSIIFRFVVSFSLFSYKNHLFLNGQEFLPICHFCRCHGSQFLYSASNCSKLVRSTSNTKGNSVKLAVPIHCQT